MDLWSRLLAAPAAPPARRREVGVLEALLQIEELERRVLAAEQMARAAEFSKESYKVAAEKYYNWLESENHGLRQEVAALKRSLSTAEKQRDAALKCVADGRDCVAKREAELSRERTRLRDLLIDRDEKSAALTAAHALRSEYSARLIEAQHSLSTKIRHVSERDATIELLQSESKRYGATVSKQQAELAAKDLDLRDFTKQVTALRAKIADLESEVALLVRGAPLPLKPNFSRDGAAFVAIGISKEALKTVAEPKPHSERCVGSKLNLSDIVSGGPLPAIHAALMEADQYDVANYLHSMTAIEPQKFFRLATMYLEEGNERLAGQLLWHLNLPKYSVPPRYKNSVARIIGAFAREPDFPRFVVRLAAECLQTTTWALVVLGSTFDLDRLKWSRATPPALSPVVEKVLALLNSSSSELAMRLAAELRTVYTGTRHSVVVYGRHKNDPEDYQSVEVMPFGNELALPMSDDRLVTLAFTKTSTDLTMHVGRHFRLLREDVMSEVRKVVAAFANPTVAPPGSRKTQQPFGIAEAAISIDHRGIVTLSGQCLIPPDHSAAGDKKKVARLIETSKGFFADGTLVVLYVAGGDGQNECYTAVIRRISRKDFNIENVDVVRQQPSDGKRHDPTQRKASTVDIEVELLGCPEALLDPMMMETTPSLPCSAYATRLQWGDNLSLLTSLQRLTSIPFESVLLTGKLPPAAAAAASPSCSVPRGIDLSAAQRAAFDAALSQPVSLIQGPPGTGKTHMATAIITAVVEQTDGCVLIMSYTNHALDQLLVRVHEALPGRRADRFLRLGAGSKDELVKNGFMLRLNGGPDKKVERELSNLQMTLQDLESPHAPAIVDEQLAHLILHWYEIDELEDREGERRFMKRMRLFNMWLNGARVDKLPHAMRVTTENRRWFAFNTTPKQRHAWVASLQSKIRAQHAVVLRKIRETAETLQASVQCSRAKSVPSSVRVFGMTTTYAAQNPHFVQRLLEQRPGATLLIEEAAEILESRVLACLAGAEALGRIILIGDHKQLPPKIETWQFQRESGRGFDLNCSLFERLIDAQFPYTPLDIQHRMFHKLSRIVRALSYPKLEDATPGGEAPIPGFANQLFFADHEHPERGGSEADGDDTSKSNPGEAQLLVAAVRHLLLQDGVGAADVAIITPYLGQVTLLRAELQKIGKDVELAEADAAELASSDDDEDGVKAATKAAAAKCTTAIRVSTVDNFQGEEARFVFVSMVRSNNRGDIGWVREKQRITVMLSRAKQGLIVFGNRETLTKKTNSAWQQVLSPELWDPADIGSLKVCCARHPQKVQLISSAEDFARLAPGGGCRERCAAKLPCGHQCAQKCHGASVGHTKSCSVPVVRRCPLNAEHVFDVKCGNLGKTAKCPHCAELQAIAQRAREEAAAEERRHAEHLAKLEQERVRLEAQALLARQKAVRDAEKREKKMKVAQARLDKAVSDEKSREEALTAETILQQRLLVLSEEARRAEASSNEAELRDSIAIDAKVCILKVHHESRLAELSDKTAELLRHNAIELQRRIDRAREELETRNAEEHQKLEAAQAAGAEIAATANAQLFIATKVCLSCTDEDLASNLIICPRGKHFLHVECFEIMVVSQLDEPDKRHKGEVHCAFCKMESMIEFFGHRTLITKLPEETYGRFDKARLSHYEASAEERGRELEREEHQRRENESVVGRLVRECQERMVPRCPRCATPWIRGDGCAAMTCTKRECRAAFCACCMEDCGSDAHAHVANCPYNPRRPDVFPSPEQLDAAHDRYFRGLNHDALKGQPADVRNAVWAQLYSGAEFPAARPGRRQVDRSEILMMR